MLGGEPGECLVPEAVEHGDRGVAVGQPLPERGDLVLEAGDLGVAAVGDVAGLLTGLKPGLEFLAEAGVGPGAVKGGPVDGGLAGEGLDVALAAGRDVAGEEPVDGGPDPGLVLLALLGADAHYCWAPFWPAAVSISVRTRLARS